MIINSCIFGGEMSLQRQFEKFNEKIHLTREESLYSNARDKDKSILESIKARFKEKGYPVVDDFIQGSLATFTAIKELSEDFDIDRGIVISEDNAPQNPLEPKKEILDILEKRGFQNAKIKTPCVTADYKNENLHIDIPVYKRDSRGNHKLAIGKSDSSKEWGDADPKGLIDWINDFSSYYDYYKDAHRNQFRRLVRYMKKWRNVQFSDDEKKKIYSIGLAIMLKECYSPSIDNEGFANDLTSLINTINSILNSSYFSRVSTDIYELRITLPVKPNNNIYAKKYASIGTQLRNKLLALKTSLEQVSSPEKNLCEQTTLLSKQFGDEFPIVSSDSSNNKSGNNIQDASLYISSGIVGTSQGA